MENVKALILRSITVAGQRVGCNRMVTSQVMSESPGLLPSMGSWLRIGKNSSESFSKLKKGLFMEKHTL